MDWILIEKKVRKPEKECSWRSQMDGLISFLSSHHLTLAVTIAAAVLIAYFVFKKLMKLALLCLLITLGIAGYFYLKEPGRTWKNMGELWQKTRVETVKAVETGKKTFAKGKDVYEKGKKFSDSMDFLVGRDKDRQSNEKGSVKIPD